MPAPPSTTTTPPPPPPPPPDLTNSGEARRDADERHKVLEAGTYDVPELAALLKCSERHICNMAEGGTIPGILRFGRLLRFHRGIVNKWLAEEAKGATRG